MQSPTTSTIQQPVSAPTALMGTFKHSHFSTWDTWGARDRNKPQATHLPEWDYTTCLGPADTLEGSPKIGHQANHITLDL